MTRRSGTFGESTSGSIDFFPQTSSASSMRNRATKIDGYLLNLDYVAGAALKQALLEASPSSISVYPADLPHLELDPDWFIATLDLQNLVENAQGSVRKGQELCVEGPGIVTFIGGGKKKVGEILGETAITGKLQGAKFLSYFRKHRANRKSGPASIVETKFEVCWGPAVVLEEPTYFDLSGGTERKGDLVHVPILPGEMPWAHATRSPIEPFY